MGLNATEQGYIDVPIYTYIDQTRWDNNGPIFDNCNYAHTSDIQRVDNDTVYAKYLDLKTKLTPAFVEEKFLNDQN